MIGRECGHDLQRVGPVRRVVAAWDIILQGVVELLDDGSGEGCRICSRGIGTMRSGRPVGSTGSKSGGTIERDLFGVGRWACPRRGERAAPLHIELLQEVAGPLVAAEPPQGVSASDQHQRPRQHLQMTTAARWGLRRRRYQLADRLSSQRSSDVASCPYSGGPALAPP
jgi:hypothetical protein